VRVAAGDLARFVARAFERLGVLEADAWGVADLMVEAISGATTPTACSGCATT
jgi:hypothetical protein